MYLFFVALHVVLCVLLMLIIILQPGKRADLGAALGGGGSSLFEQQGPVNLLQRATTAVAVLFMMTSITLALYSSRSLRSNANVEDELERAAARKASQAQAVAVPAEAGEPVVVPVVPAEGAAPPPEAVPANPAAPSPAE
jgi:preprotein translocase subunit SecG